MAVDHCLLGRRKCAVLDKAFDRDDVTAVELKQEANARIDGPETTLLPVRRIGDEHGAVAAVALRADVLGAHEAQPAAEVVAEREKHVAAANLATNAVDPD